MIFGVFVSVALILGIVIFSRSRSTKTNKVGAGLVSGMILGTLIGGACTIGTAQLAFLYGLSAWWYCLGGCLGCLILALKFSVPIRGENGRTLVGIVAKEFGMKTGLAATLLNSIGTFINILSQLIAATSVIAVIDHDVGLISSLMIAAIFMIAYAIIGGSRGVGMAGLVKLALLYVSMLVCGYLSVRLGGGINTILGDIGRITSESGVQYLSLFGRGMGLDLGACLSLIVGIITTQIYAQALTVATSNRDAQVGAMISGLMIPLVGIGGILVGLYMRIHFPTIPAKTALTQFIVTFLPGFPGGLVLGTLLITVVACGAGLALGIATVLYKDIVLSVLKIQVGQFKGEFLTKILIVLVLALATLLCAILDNDIILNYAYLSMALRGAVLLVPLCFALWLKGRVRPTYAMVSIIIGPLLVFIFKALDVFPFDSLFVGISLAFITMYFGMRMHNVSKVGIQ